MALGFRSKWPESNWPPRHAHANYLLKNHVKIISQITQKESHFANYLTFFGTDTPRLA